MVTAQVFFGAKISPFRFAPVEMTGAVVYLKLPAKLEFEDAQRSKKRQRQTTRNRRRT